MKTAKAKRRMPSEWEQIKSLAQELCASDQWQQIKSLAGQLRACERELLHLRIAAKEAAIYLREVGPLLGYEDKGSGVHSMIRQLLKALKLRGLRELRAKPSIAGGAK